LWYRAYVSYLQEHQSGNVADWQLVPASKRTRIQQIAAASRGVVTPANFLSFLGLAGVGVGLFYSTRHEWTLGLVCIGLGRLADILDGIVAHHTGTKSPLGEAVDASFDKMAAFATLLVFGATGVIPWWLFGIVLVQNIANSMFGLLGRRWRVVVHPVATGKLATVLQWGGLLAFVLAMVSSRNWLEVAYATMAAGLLLGAAASWHYARTVLRARAASADKSSSTRAS